MNNFTYIYCEQNLSRSLIVFEVRNISQLLRKTSIGQFVKSEKFELNFPKSIGLSMWELLLFPNGQYDSKGMVDEKVHLYLKIIKCTGTSEEIKLDVKFQLESSVGCKLHQIFCYNNVRTRWTGADLIGADKLLINTDVVMISVQLTEHSKRSNREDSAFTRFIPDRNTKTSATEQSMASEIRFDIGEVEEDTVNATFKMENLLKSWNLAVLFEKLDKCGFDFYSLQAIVEEDIVKMFKEDMYIGPLRKFRLLHAQWINTLAMSSVSNKPQVGSTEVSSVTLINDTEKNSVLNVKSILEDSIAGQSLLKYYQKEMNFLPEHRKVLVGIISDYLIENFQKRTSRTKIGELCGQISLLFRNESKNDYQVKVGKNWSGLLENCYNNKLAAFEKKKKKIKSWEGGSSNKNVIELDSEEEIDPLNDEIKSNIEWLKNNESNCDRDGFLEEILVHWKACYEYRNSKAKLEETFDDFITEFPLLKCRFGFTMVSYDFEVKYPNANDGLRSYWNDFFKTNIHTMVQIINDSDLKQILRDVSKLDDTCHQNVQLAMALHGLTIPSSVTLGNKRWKPTIETSQGCFYQFVLSKQEMEKKLKKELSNCDKKCIQHYPMIFGIGGDDKHVSEYNVVISGVYYTFPTFLQAMDGAFKCFIFYKISFPTQTIRYWSLINAIFYKIGSIDLKLTPTLSAILRSLKVKN